MGGLMHLDGGAAMADERKHIGVLGVGNLLLMDEGLGIHLVRYLEAHFDLPPEVVLQDGGTAGIMLIPFIESCRVLLVVDALAIDAPPGTVREYCDGEVHAGLLATGLSPHQLGFLEALEICRLQDRAPERLVVIGVCPAVVGAGVELSPTIGVLLPALADRVAVRLVEFGVAVVRRSMEASGA
ncbi:MAG: HyaD/HybD family hydrogenase maturation endopeptidase [Deltaproteobacteria bacterium]|nr:HyaD/HybD family hydrogenase maturation endopeptidase [Candidatus Anaeroferrophillacea bacterium]